MVELTVYNDNLALVKDIRNIKLPVGQGKLKFMDVASHIMPATVHARSSNYPFILALQDTTVFDYSRIQIINKNEKSQENVEFRREAQLLT